MRFGQYLKNFLKFFRACGANPQKFLRISKSSSKIGPCPFCHVPNDQNALWGAACIALPCIGIPQSSLVSLGQPKLGQVVSAWWRGETGKLRLEPGQGGRGGGEARVVPLEQPHDVLWLVAKRSCEDGLLDS